MTPHEWVSRRKIKRDGLTHKRKRSAGGRGERANYLYLYRRNKRASKKRPRVIIGVGVNNTDRHIHTRYARKQLKRARDGSWLTYRRWAASARECFELFLVSVGDNSHDRWRRYCPDCIGLFPRLYYYTTMEWWPSSMVSDDGQGVHVQC